MIVTTVSYPGINQIESMIATIDHGITAGQIQLRFAPQSASTIRLYGEMRITYDGSTVIFTNCIADRATYQFNETGEAISLVIRDFRWTWEHGTISGRYNVKNADGTIRILNDAEPSDTDAIGNSKKTPQELATLLLEAMGVETFDVAQLPNDTLPFVDWEHANPAQELAKLCESLGYSIVPTTTGEVRLLKLGTGNDLPPGPIESSGETVNPANPPKRIGIVCGPTLAQFDFWLDPVGLDLDGEIREIQDLSYAPAGGWINGQGDLDAIIDDKARTLAEKTVHKWFRTLEADMQFGRFPFFTYVEETLPIMPFRIEKTKLRGLDVEKPATVFGEWYPWKTGRNRNTVSDYLDIDRADSDFDVNFAYTFVPYPFELDGELGLVKFSEPINRIHRGNLIHARLWIRTACRLRELATGNFTRTVIYRDIDPTSPAGDRLVRHDEIVNTLIYNAELEPLDNIEDVERECNHYLDELEQEYQFITPQTATYVGILNAELDGAIQVVSWSFNSKGASTMISRNDDRGSPITKPYKERRKQELAAAVAAGALL